MPIGYPNMYGYYNGYGGYSGFEPAYGGWYGRYNVPQYSGYGYGYEYFNPPNFYAGYSGIGFNTGWIWALLILIVILLLFGRNFNRNTENNSLISTNCCDNNSILGLNTNVRNTGFIDNSILFIIIIFLLLICCWSFGGWGGYGRGYW